MRNLRSIPVFCLCLLSVVLLISCGKKGPPTLKSYEKPASPSNLTAVHREDRITLSWSYPEGLRKSIEGFDVLRSDDGGFGRVASVENDKSSFADVDFKVGVPYRYKLVARNMRDIPSDDSNVIVVAPKSTPAAPEEARAKVESDSIELSWKGAGGDVCYNIYKSSEQGKYPDAPLNRKPECGNSFRDQTLSPGSSVFYTVRALLQSPIRDESYASDEVEVNSSHFVPAAPSDLRVVTGEGKIYLTWKESRESWVKGYRIYRKIRGEKDFSLVGEVNTPVFTFSAESGRKSRYLIKAVGPSVESEPSSVDVP